jgi:predicted lactoylglutathione lyase
MKVSRRIIVQTAAAAFLVVAAHPAAAGYSPGGAFRAPGYGARAWGMGGAAIATVDDESAVYWNPGMMSFAAGSSLGASYINLVPGATAHLSQMAYVRVLAKHDNDTSGRPIARHAVGAMYTNLRLGLQDGEGYDENVFRLAYAYSPDHLVTFAIAWDILASTSDIGGFTSRGTSVDGALRLSVTENTTFAMVARNAFSRYSYQDGADYRREREVVLALASKSLPYIALEGDLAWSHGGTSRLTLGAESDYLFDVLALRAGIASIRTGESRTVPYFGFGVHISHLALHYNASLDKEIAFSDTHRFTVSVSF